MMTVQRDKLYHFFAGFLLCIIFSIINDPVTGMGAAIGGGIMKECYDRYDYGKFDIADMIATWIGGAVGFALVNLIQYWKS